MTASTQSECREIEYSCIYGKHAMLKRLHKQRCCVDITLTRITGKLLILLVASTLFFSLSMVHTVNSNTAVAVHCPLENLEFRYPKIPEILRCSQNEKKYINK